VPYSYSLCHPLLIIGANGEFFVNTIAYGIAGNYFDFSTNVNSIFNTLPAQKCESTGDDGDLS